MTAACCVTRRAVWDEVDGLDEENFAVAYNDVDYCLKVREAGYLVAWTPDARLLHETSASQRANVEGKALEEKNARFARERSWRCIGNGCRRSPSTPLTTAISRRSGTGFAVETEGRADLGSRIPAARASARLSR